MNFWERLDNYARQNGGEDVLLTSAQQRRLLHKDRRATGTLGNTWIHGGKNRPTRRQRDHHRSD